MAITYQEFLHSRANTTLGVLDEVLNNPESSLPHDLKSSLETEVAFHLLPDVYARREQIISLGVPHDWTILMRLEGTQFDVATNIIGFLNQDPPTLRKFVTALRSEVTKLTP